MNPLQTSLGINALFSGISGTVLIIFHHQLAQLFGIENNTVFWMIGIALLFFALTIGYEIIKQRPLAVLWIIVQDFLWVLGSGILLVLHPFAISPTGNVLIGIAAFIVLLMGFNQSRALARVDNNPEKAGKTWQFERIVKADKRSVWKLISDVGNYHMFAPNIDEVKIVSGDGPGMVRMCSHGKDSWAETCTVWTEEKEYAYAVQTNEPDYPYPFKFLNGFWRIEAIDQATTKIVMRFDFQYNKKFQNVLLHPLFRTKFHKVAEELLDNWQAALEQKSYATAIEPSQ